MDRRTFLSFLPALFGASCADMAVIQNSLKGQRARVPVPPIRSPRGNWPWSAFHASLSTFNSGTGAITAAVFGDDTNSFLVNLALFCSDVPVLCWVDNMTGTLDDTKAARVFLVNAFASTTADLTASTVIAGEVSAVSIDGEATSAYIASFLVDDGQVSVPLAVCCVAQSGVIAGPFSFLSSGADSWAIVLRASDYSAVLAHAGFDPRTHTYTAPGSGNKYTVVGAYDSIQL